MDFETDAPSPLLDAETRAHENPADHQDEVRLWLRMLTCTTLIESEIRRRLRERFDVTLPRFDLMAQLEKAPEGMTLGALSQRMMVSNGNITGLVERLADQGLVAREAHPTDRRVAYVRLTPAGRTRFLEMAAVHAGWTAEFYGTLTPGELRETMRLLGRVKQSVRARIDTREDADA
jgi:DNA-binding MarR family transcriptional regulator